MYQTCMNCDSATGRCKEDEFRVGEVGPLCEDCFDSVEAYCNESKAAFVRCVREMAKDTAAMSEESWVRDNMRGVISMCDAEVK